MYKTITYSVIALLIIGCGSKDVEIQTRMFQSVDKEDAILVQKNETKTSCARCGMNLVKFYKTSHIASANNKKFQYCSIHCLAEHLKDSTKLKNPQVVDIGSLKFISVSKAYYVVGSDKRGTMSRVSKYAFSSLEMAKKFQDKYGGDVVDFYKALDIAREDFK